MRIHLFVVCGILRLILNYNLYNISSNFQSIIFDTDIETHSHYDIETETHSQLTRLTSNLRWGRGDARYARGADTIPHKIAKVTLKRKNQRTLKINFKICIL